METVKTLTCKFKDSDGRLRSIAIDAPKDNVTAQELNDFMNAAIIGNVLQLNDLDTTIALQSIVGAEISVRTTTDLDLTIE